jgi:hypothetical protein
LRQYEEVAATTEDIVSTDIPSSALDDFVDLAFLVQDAPIRSVVFDTSVINPAYPDYDLMRHLVEEALAPPPAPSSPASTATSSPASSSPSSTDTSSGTTEPTKNPVDELADACAYDPEQAQKALDAGEPPTKNG